MELSEARALVPKDCGLIHAWEPQMMRLAGHKKTILMLGTCRKHSEIPSIENPICTTEKACAALEMEGYAVLLLDMRQTCQRHHDGTGCRAFDTYAQESTLMTLATAINIAVAEIHYKIKFVGVISFAEVWFKKYSTLEQLVPSIAGLHDHHFHIDSHLGWVGRVASRVSDRVASNERTKAFKDISYNLSGRVLDLPAETIYNGFYTRLSDLGLSA